MEVVSGEHGDCLEKLVTALNNKESINQSQSSSTTTNENTLFNYDKNISPNSTNLTVVEILNENIQKPSIKISTTDLHDTSTTTIDIPENNDKKFYSDKSTIEGSLRIESMYSSSLLNESDDVEACQNKKDKLDKYTFTTSSWVQFRILLKRTFISIVRDKTLTQMRLLSHIIVGAIIGMIYYDIGNDASKM